MISAKRNGRSVRRKRWLVLAAAPLLMAMTASAARPHFRLANFELRVLAAHNAERATLGLRPLAWDKGLALNAAMWARVQARTHGLHHDLSLDVEGENLWRGTRGAYTPEDMVGLWIVEKRRFRNNPLPNASITGRLDDVGHYTQVVWRSTTEVGCAVADAAGGDEVMVCRYLEGGNVLGEKAF